MPSFHLHPSKTIEKVSPYENYPKWPCQSFVRSSSQVAVFQCFVWRLPYCSTFFPSLIGNKLTIEPAWVMVRHWQFYFEDSSVVFLTHAFDSRLRWLGTDYSKTCLKRPPHGARKSGRYRQVVSKAWFPQNRPIFRSSVEQLRTLWYARVWSTQWQFTSIWCKRWPHAIVFSQTCAVVAVLTKQRFSLLLVAEDRENPVVGAKNAGRWSR